MVIPKSQAWISCKIKYDGGDEYDHVLC
jgi:hypothetical protein